jgi:hypothetical protein
MAKRVALFDEQPSLEDIAEHHRDLDASLRLYFSERSPKYVERFAGYTSQGVRDELRRRLDEVNKTSSLTVLAAVEAAFRVDYLRRSRQKKKDPAARALREIYKKKQDRASLDEDILEAWIGHSPEVRPLISELRGAFRFRHWLAHGRCFEAKLGRLYDSDSLYVLAERTSTAGRSYDGDQGSSWWR